MPVYEDFLPARPDIFYEIIKTGIQGRFLNTKHKTGIIPMVTPFPVFPASGHR